MALINCSECGTQMSDKAQTCPKCGAPNPEAVPTQQMAYTPYFNPCATHPQAPAVAVCGNCGSSMCKECKDTTAYLLDNKPLCPNCNLLYMEENISHLKSAKRWSTVKFVLLSIIVFMAWGIIQGDPSNENNIIGAWIIASIGGLFSSFAGLKRSEGEKAADALYSKLNPEDAIFNEGMGGFTRIIVGVLFAPIYTVISTIKNLIRMISSSSKLKKAQKEYTEYTTLLRERGDI